jgi:hypothetical protein
MAVQHAPGPTRLSRVTSSADRLQRATEHQLLFKEMDGEIFRPHKLTCLQNLAHRRLVQRPSTALPRTKPTSKLGLTEGVCGSAWIPRKTNQTRPWVVKSGVDEQTAGRPGLSGTRQDQGDMTDAHVRRSIGEGLGQRTGNRGNTLPHCRSSLRRTAGGAHTARGLNLRHPMRPRPVSAPQSRPPPASSKAEDVHVKPSRCAVGRPSVGGVRIRPDVGRCTGGGEGGGAGGGPSLACTGLEHDKGTASLLIEPEEPRSVTLEVRFQPVLLQDILRTEVNFPSLDPTLQLLDPRR